MLFVVALLIWFALSIPATLLLGRILSVAPRPAELPVRRAPASTRRLVHQR